MPTSTRKNTRKNSVLQSLNVTSIPPTNTLPTTKGNDRTLSILNNAIETVNVVGGLVPLELAKGVLATVSSILKRVKDTIKNQDDFVELAEQCNKIGLLIWRATSGTPENDTSPSIRRAISELKRSVDGIQAAITEKTESGVGSRAFNVVVNKEAIDDWKQDLDRILIMFNTELNISANLKLDDLISMFEEFQSNANFNVDALLPDALPAIPPIFFGRDTIVQETVESLLTCRHVALIGPGGMGKTCIARAVLHDNAISAKFKDRRFFVRYDDIDASQITYGTFLDRIAAALGIRTSKVNQRSLISNTLSSRGILLVLDNAEIFLDAASDAGRIADSIDEFGALANVAIMLTTRTDVLPLNLIWERLPVPALEESPACEVFRMIYRPEIQPEILTKLLSSLDFHPLSINLLAQAAVQNKWTPDELVKRWEGQQSSLLNSGTGRVQSLAVTIELSLNSPSLKHLGDTALNLTQVIAFLPQGVNHNILEKLFPATENIQSAADMLCKHSLAYRKGDFITMLAPIRLYISTAYKSPSLSAVPMLEDVRRYYTAELAREPVDGAWTQIEDINLEHVIALILGQSDATNMNQALHTCQSFIEALLAHKPRSTAFYPVITALQADPASASCLGVLSFSGNKKILVSKGDCLAQLGILTFQVGQLIEAREILGKAKDTFVTCGSAAREELRAIETLIGAIYDELGNFSAAEEAYTLARKKAPLFKSASTRHVNAYINLALGAVRMVRGRPGGVELTLKAQKYLDSIGEYDAASYGELQVGYDDLLRGKNESARRHFDNVLAASASSTDTDSRLSAFMALIDVCRREGKTAEAKAFLSRLRETARVTKGTLERITAYTVAAAYIAMDGNIPEGREEINRLVAEAKALSSISLTVMKAQYIAAMIELLANDRTAARALLSEVLKQCEALSEMRFKARTVRALGEVSYLDQDFATATAKFAETKGICDFMGITPDRLYYCESCFILGDEFKGWRLFTEGRFPST